MNLQELQESKKTKIVKRALREHYELELDFEKLSLPQTQQMLGKVKGLLKESRSTPKIYSSHQNSAYIKLVMMEQALADRLNDLRNPYTRVVVENEEVQRSQVILAVQDMIDNLQKMLEDVSKMNVEELNAVINGMKNEFGAVEGDKFSQEVGAALTTLQGAITAAKTSVSASLSAVTGEGGDMESGMDMGEPGMDMGEPGMDMGEPGMDMGGAPELPQEEPEGEDLTGAGRERR